MALLLPLGGCLRTGSFALESSDCPMTVIPPSPSSALSNSGIRVIHNQAEWESYYNNGPETAPPVDFNSQMLVVASVPSPCVNLSLNIRKVCEDDSQVTVYVTSITCPDCPNCFLMPDRASITSEVAVPLSNLPVSIETKQVTRDQMPQ